MGLLDGNALGGRTTAEFFHDIGLNVTDQKLGHGRRMLSLLSNVKPLKPRIRKDHGMSGNIDAGQFFFVGEILKDGQFERDRYRDLRELRRQNAF